MKVKWIENVLGGREMIRIVAAFLPLLSPHGAVRQNNFKRKSKMGGIR
jgi:hypothetical protein